MLPFRPLLFFISHYYVALFFKTKNYCSGYFGLFYSERKAEFKTLCHVIAMWFFSSKLLDHTLISSCFFVCVCVLKALSPSGQAASRRSETLSSSQKEKQRVHLSSTVLLQFLLQHSRTHHRQFLHALAKQILSVPLVILSTDCGEGQSSVMSLLIPAKILRIVAGKTVTVILGMEAGEAEKRCVGHILKCLFWLKWTSTIEVMRKSHVLWQDGRPDGQADHRSLIFKGDVAKIHTGCPRSSEVLLYL